MQETDFVSGFARGLKVIETFGETTPRLAIADVAKATGLDRATARRCLLTLAELGYADYDGKFFVLTPKILRLGHAYLSATPCPTSSSLFSTSSPRRFTRAHPRACSTAPRSFISPAPRRSGLCRST
ncbi:helix-turn-helix domain-containing protein (plasmid) [Neorhizobium galegae]|nr:helix-turn-helix domain-containing protein [Neorhizobium galegae]